MRGYAAGDSDPDVIAGARRLHEAGARRVLVSRESGPAVLIDDDASPAQIELAPPRFEALDERGTGDSMFAATGVGLSRGMSMVDALRLGMAAGALNASAWTRDRHPGGDRAARRPRDHQRDANSVDPHRLVQLLTPMPGSAPSA
jgi:fructose-1-phosphate kinase PfkB-like protein